MECDIVAQDILVGDIVCRCTLQKLAEHSDVFITTTDKSSKMAIIEMKEYIRMGEVHTKNDRTIDEEELYMIQKDINNHTLNWLNIFKVGETHGDRNVTRIKAGYTSRACAPPTLSLLVKDHKTIKKDEPMPSRPLVGISTTMLSRGAKLLSDVIKHVADNQPNSLETKSRENLQALYMEANERYRNEAMQMKLRTISTTEDRRYINNGPLIVFSMDVVALYPSITAELGSRRIREAMEKTEVNFDVDMDVALRYL